MGFDYIWIGCGIAIAGYFIGNGLKNFNNPGGNVLGGIGGIFDEDDEHELINENDVHHFGYIKRRCKVFGSGSPRDTTYYCK